jgi:pancreatic lipase-related protein 1/phosphatidic acid-selective phospholipase A1
MALLGVVSLLAFATVAWAAERCCPPYGCFNDNAPFNLMPLPTCPQNCRLVATMFTRSNRNNGQVVTDTSVPSVFSAARRTVFEAHGWNGGGNNAWLHDMKNAYLDREDINVVVYDWGGCAQNINYNQAAADTRSAGRYITAIVQRLLQVGGSSPARMWCVGHSLGSHVCGHAGMYLPANQRLGRATGMDPAGPLFEVNNNKLIGINPTSATFVDILHTDGTDAASLGTRRDLGHIDFYPNGGGSQTGCGSNNSCSHSRAYQFMTESIKRDCFHATQRCTNFNNLPGSCTNCGGCGAFPCAYMGYAAESSCNRSGMYYLQTNAGVPYCRN